MQDPRKIRPGGAYDVIVVGGGVAGISAAVAAARLKMRVLLIEKTIVLGGLATIGLISWYEPLCDGQGQQMIGGIADELLRRAIRYGFDDLPTQWGGDAATSKAGGRRYATHYSPTLAAMAWEELVQESGAEIRLDTWVVCPVMEGRLCKGLLCESVGGREYFEAKVIVDATGDASVLDRAGMPTVLGDNYLSFVAHYTNREIAQEFAQGGTMARARRWKAVASNLYGQGHPEGLPLFQGATGWDVTDFVLRGRKILLDDIKTQDRDERDLTMLPMMPQYRKIRRLEGAYCFLGTEQGLAFEDSIGTMGDFRKSGPRFQLPYRTLYHGDYPNLLAAGRIISAEGEGWEIARVIPTAALSGHGAGVAAALAVGQGVAVGEISIPALQKTLRDQGGIFAL